MKVSYTQYTLRAPEDVEKIIEDERKNVFLKEGKLLSINEILLRLIRASSNGYSENVSQPPSQPDSNQKNKEDPIQSPEVVPKNVSNKLSDTFKFTL